MKLQKLRGTVLLLAACLALGFLAWQWIKPYQWQADPAAAAKIDFARVTRDHSFFWLDLRLKVPDPAAFDLSKPLLLILADGREKKPDTLTREGAPGMTMTAESSELPQVDAISLKFWLEENEIAGPLRLRINDGSLIVRDGREIPKLENSGSVIHKDKNW